MAVKIQFVAPLIRAAMATLKANLPTQLAVFNAEEDNGVQLAEPAAILFGAADPLLVFPTIEVSVPSGRGSRASGALGALGSSVDHFPALNVCCWHEGDAGELSPTYEMSLGYTRCILECLLPVGALGEYGVTTDAAGSPLFSWRTSAIPEDPTPDGRVWRKWRVPVLIQLAITSPEQFEQA